MKKTIAILLLSIYLLSQIRISEFVKVDALMQHFYETKISTPHVTFFHFLVMHYLTNDLNSADNDRDMELPFKSAETNISNIDIIYLSDNGLTTQPKPVFCNSNRTYLQLNHWFVFSNYHILVWNPPKCT